MAYPTSLDSYTTISSGTTMADGGHRSLHNSMQDQIVALETKVGVDSSAVATSLDYLVKNTSSSNPGHKHTLANGATDVTASAAELNLLDGITVLSGSNTGDQDLSGLVTKATVDAKGDLLVGSADNTVTRLAAGTDGQILESRASEATGLKWIPLPTSVSVTTKGDIQTYSTTPDRLPVGTDGYLLEARSTEATGLKWVAAPSTSPLTTKGDLYTYSTTNARLAVGTNGKVLMADSGETTGLKWASTPTISQVVSEVPSGTVNSSNVTFTLAATPVTGSLQLFVNGVRQKPTEDYSITDLTITMVVAPETGDLLLADYFTTAGDISQGSTSFVYDETPSGTINGSNVTFTIANTPVSGTLQLYRDGQLLKAGGADYTLSGTTITFVTAPATSSVLTAFYQLSLSVAGNADTVDGIHASDYPADGYLVPSYGGWNKLNCTLTYSSADDPTYVVTTSGDLTGIVGVGMRIKFTNNSTTFYGIVTAITSTTITIYGGTDYDVANSAITAPYFSYQKAPLGFPLDVKKWRIHSDVGVFTQSNPTANTWYNTGKNIVIPIGSWDVCYNASVQGYKIGATQMIVNLTLSTTTNSETDDDMTTWLRVDGGAGNPSVLSTPCFRRTQYTIASKGTYSLLLNTPTASMNQINLMGDSGKATITAVCAYL